MNPGPPAWQAGVLVQARRPPLPLFLDRSPGFIRILLAVFHSASAIVQYNSVRQSLYLFNDFIQVCGYIVKLKYKYLSEAISDKC